MFEKSIHMIGKTKRIWLLLDYDGTLAEFAATPDEIIPDAALITLIEEIANHPKLDVAIISGRRLAHIEKLLPIGDIWLAGSYGLEMRMPSGEYLQRADFEQLRPQLEQLKPAWAELIAGKEGFYLEDKGWSLALHARFAPEAMAKQILEKARQLANQKVMGEAFNILGGHKFLEIAPHEADKGQSVAFLLDKYATPNTLPIYLGDDDKDERAFPVVQAWGGLAGCVSSPPRKTIADFNLSSPQEARSWLQSLLDRSE
jgi:trehalose 6-phosphate phosphatase